MKKLFITALLLLTLKGACMEDPSEGKSNTPATNHTNITWEENPLAPTASDMSALEDNNALASNSASSSVAGSQSTKKGKWDLYNFDLHTPKQERVKKSEEEKERKLILPVRVPHGHIYFPFFTAFESLSSASRQLLYGVVRENERIVQRAFAAGADVNVADRRGYTALHYAVAKNCSIAGDLIDHGANPTLAEPKYLQTPLHFATTYEMLETLMRSGQIEVNLKDKLSNTPLSLAIERCDSASVEFLLSQAGIRVKSHHLKLARRSCAKYTAGVQAATNWQDATLKLSQRQEETAIKDMLVRCLNPSKNPPAQSQSQQEQLKEIKDLYTFFNS